MADYWEIGAAKNAAELEAIKGFGTLVGFRHRSNLAVPLHARIRRNDPLDASTEGKTSDVRELELVIPAQAPAFSGVSGFSGAVGVSACSGSQRPVATGDRVEFPIGSTTYFWVQEGVTTLNEGHTFVVVASSQRTSSGGQRA